MSSLENTPQEGLGDAPPQGQTAPLPAAGDLPTRSRHASDYTPPESLVDGPKRQLDPANIVVSTIEGWITTVVFICGFLIALGAGWLLDWFPVWLDWTLAGVWIGLAAFLSWLAIRWPRWEHDRTAFRVTPLGIEIWKGVIWRRVISVPRSRIQHTDVAQGPLQRRYGLATLRLHTAGSEHANVELAGFKHATALAIRDFLITSTDEDAV